MMVAACLVFQAAKPASAGPWSKDLGQFYAKVGQDFFWADSFRDSSGKLVKGTNYLGSTTSFYGEVGLSRGFHLQAYLPYMVGRNSFDDGGSFSRGSGGDAIFALQFKPIWPLPFPVALRLEVKVPLYDVAGVDSPLAEQFPAPGDGQLDFSYWLSLGGSIDSLGIYLFAELGYIQRTEVFVGKGIEGDITFRDGVGFRAQAAYILFNRLHLGLTVNGVIAAASDETTKSTISVGPLIYCRLWEGLAVEASFSPAVYAKNSAMGMSAGLGLSYRK